MFDLLVFEVNNFEGQGEKFWLSRGQQVEVGRAHNMDFVFPDDPRMSGRHFSLEVASDACVLRDLNSTNGTSVNGQSINTCRLRDGDVVVAGRTRFRVTIYGRVAEEAVDTGSKEDDTSWEAAPAYTIGGWIGNIVPANWKLDADKGLRWIGPGSFPTKMVMSEISLPEELSLNDYVESILEKTTASFAESETDGPSTVEIRGANEALRIDVGHSSTDDFSVVQSLYFVRMGAMVGTLSVTTSSQDWKVVQSSMPQVLASLRFLGVEVDHGDLSQSADSQDSMTNNSAIAI